MDFLTNRRIAGKLRSIFDTGAPAVPFVRPNEVFSSVPQLGIFSGQPMPAWATPLPLEWLFNKSSR